MNGKRTGWRAGWVASGRARCNSIAAHPGVLRWLVALIRSAAARGATVWRLHSESGQLAAGNLPCHRRCVSFIPCTRTGTVLQFRMARATKKILAKSPVAGPRRALMIQNKKGQPRMQLARRAW